MATHGKKAWREVLRQLNEDLKQRFVSDSEFIRRVWAAWSEWLSEYGDLISESHFYDLEYKWKIRPNLNSTYAEFHWFISCANSRSGRFWGSALLRKVLESFRQQRRNMDWSTARDLNIISHYFGW